MLGSVDGCVTNLLVVGDAPALLGVGLMFLRFLVGNWFAGGDGVEHGHAPEMNLIDGLSGGRVGILRDDEDGLRGGGGIGGEAGRMNQARRERVSFKLGFKLGRELACELVREEERYDF